MIERQAALEDDADHPMHRQQLVDRAKGVERLPLDVIHHQPRLFLFDHRVVYAHDVRMLEPAADRVLGLEQLAQAARHRRIVLVEANQLDRHVFPGVRIGRQIDDGRRALAEFAHDFVFADFFCHSSLRRTDEPLRNRDNLE